MLKRIPIKAVRALAKAHGLTHAILFGYNDVNTNQYVVTWGKTTVNSAEACDLGNALKQALKWPENLCHVEPSRVKRLKAQLGELRMALLEATQPPPEPGLASVVKAGLQGPTADMVSALKVLRRLNQEAAYGHDVDMCRATKMVIQKLEPDIVGCITCPYKGQKPCSHCEGCAYR